MQSVSTTDCMEQLLPVSAALLRLAQSGVFAPPDAFVDHLRVPQPEETHVTTTVTQIERPDGRVELTDTTAIERSPLYNEDLAPVPIARRNWTTYNYAALWVSMAHCIPTYMLSAGLMAAGMSW